MPERIRIGIIGGGMISQVAHLPFYFADPRCEVAAIAESRHSLVQALAPQYPAARIVPHHREILQDPRIAAVVIVAPRPSMAPLALEALRAGKHVMMEKPMAHTAAQAAELVAAAVAAKVMLAVGFMKRHDPGIVAARHIFAELQAGPRLGRLLLARFYDFSRSYAVPPPAHTRPLESRAERFVEWPLGPEWLAESHRETFAWYVNAASHDLNLVNFFFSEVDVVSAFSPSAGAVLATLAAGDIPIALEVSKSAVGVWREGIELLYENGRLAVAIPSPMAKDQCARVVLEENVEGARRTVVETGSGWAFERQATAFIDVLSGGGSGSMTSGADGLRDLELCERIWRRIQESR
jgi:predicted dehydrogenase